MNANTIKILALYPRAFHASSGGNPEGVQMPAARRPLARIAIRRRSERRIAESIDHAANRRPSEAYEITSVSVKSKPPTRPQRQLSCQRESTLNSSLRTRLWLAFCDRC